MKPGMTISCVGHARRDLAVRLVAISAQPMEAPPVDSLPVSFISDKDFTQMTQGVKNAPKLKIDMPKPLADKVDAPKAVDQLAPKVADKPAITTDFEQIEARAEARHRSPIRSRRKKPTSRSRRNTSPTRSPIC